MIAVENIRRCQEAGYLPMDLDPEAVARGSFESLSRTVLESLAFHQRGLGYFKGRFRLERAALFTDLLKEGGPGGRGTILLTAHMANWELMPQAIRELTGAKITIVGRTQGGLLLDRLIFDTRTMTGNGFIFKDMGARAMLGVLKEGGVIGTLYDQAAIVEREGALLTFMGRPAWTNLGPVKLAAKTGAVLLPVFGARDGKEHIFEFSDPVRPPESPGQDWILKAAQDLNDVLGRRILQSPSEWMWTHRRWKTPEGVKEDPLSF
jgi:KDO2-lipid IV(A) lauroyltransferase